MLTGAGEEEARMIFGRIDCAFHRTYRHSAANLTFQVTDLRERAREQERKPERERQEGNQERAWEQERQEGNQKCARERQEENQKYVREQEKNYAGEETG